MEHRGNRRLRSAARAGTLVVAGAALAAGALSLTATAAPGGREGEWQRQGPAKSRAFEECMRERGVRPGEGRRPDQRRLERALEACRRHLPEAARRQHERMERHRECMEDHGVRPPSPGGGPPDGDTLRKALRACREHAPPLQMRTCGRHAAGPPREGADLVLPAGPPPAAAAWKVR